jgi:hypothetical protein
MMGARPSCWVMERATGLAAKRPAKRRQRVQGDWALYAAERAVRTMLCRMGQVKGQLRGRGVAVFGVDLQAMQDDLLHPRRQVGAQHARRDGLLVQPSAQAAHARGRAERARAGGEVVQDDAQGEQVAARVGAVVQHLLRGDVRSGAHGQAELLGQQVGQPIVARQAKIDQHGVAVGPEHDVARLDVVMDDVLLVQIVQGLGDARADARDLVHGQRQLLEAGAQRLPLQQFHDDVGLRLESAAGDPARHVRAVQHRQDHLLDLEADDGRRIVAQQRDLHHRRAWPVGCVTRHSSAMPPRCVRSTSV